MAASSEAAVSEGVLVLAGSVLGFRWIRVSGFRVTVYLVLELRGIPF